jgi:uncharacterized membrane protein YfcA
MLETLLLLSTGLLGGFMAGFLGIGGGIIYIIIFPFFLSDWGYSEKEIVNLTIANSILATLLSSLSGNITAILHKDFYWKEVFWIASTSVLSAILIIQSITYTPAFTLVSFNSIIIVVLVYLLVSTILRRKLRNPNAKDGGKNRPLYLGIGAFSGATAALSGLGGGAVIIPILMNYLKLDIKKAKSISLGVIFFTTLVVSLYNFLRQYTLKNTELILPGLTIPVAVAVLLSTPLGVKVSKKIPSSWIESVFIIFLCIVILNKISELYFQ